MPNDPNSIFDLYHSTLKKITASPVAWADFLRTAGQLYKYSFADQVLLYAQRPTATACAPYDLWQERMKRYVVHGSKGIALIDDSAIPPKLKFVFDIADTRPMEKDIPAPLIWSLEHKHKHWIINSLSATFNLNLHDYKEITELFAAVIPTVVKDSVEQSVAEFIANSANSQWDGLDEHSIHTFYRDTVMASATWSIMHRCGMEHTEHIELQDFCHVLDCNTAGSITCMGVAVNNVTEKVLRQVERTVKEYTLDEQKQAYLISKKRKKDYSKVRERRANHGVILQDGGQLSISEFDATNDREPDELREICATAAELPAQGETGDVHHVTDTRKAHGAFNEHRQDGEGASGDDGRLAADAGGNNRGAESGQLSGVGAANELIAEQSRALGDAGHHLHLNNSETAADGMSVALFTSKMLPQLLRYDGGLKNTKADIVSFFITQPLKEQRAAFLRSCYDDVFTAVFAEGTTHHIGYHATDDGLEVWDGNYISTQTRFTLPWSDVATRVEMLISNHQYLNEQPSQLNMFAATEAIYEPHHCNDELADSHATVSVPMTVAIPQDNYRITDMRLGEGGPKTKFAANITAIETLQRIEAEARSATPAEQESLSRYVGWGGLADAFDYTKEKWNHEYAELKALLTEEEYKAARASVLNAHYTSPTVITAIYQCLNDMGLQSGNILEPAMGVGNFFGLLPEHMANANLFGVELDSITGRIAQQLYPHASITISGFETTTWANDSFDCAVGNVPFGAYSVSDPHYDRLGFHIHDYFFAKSVDLVRPGGVVAFVTSRYTLDKKNNAVRSYLAQRCELLGAVRLPCNAFLANAGTEVTADIIFLQKRERPIVADPDWVHVGQSADGFIINQYFIDHPEMILGELVHETRLYGNETLVCKPVPDTELSELLATAVANIHGTIPRYEHRVTESAGLTADTIPADPTVRNFSFANMDGTLYYRENATMHRTDTTTAGTARIKGMITIRDVVRELIERQLLGCDDDTLHALQTRLNALYDSYTAQHGLLNSRGNKLAFSDDAGYPLLCALEILDSAGNLKCKADMFTRRTIRQDATITHVDTASEALAVSLGDRACVDLGYMSALLGPAKNVDSIIQELRGVIFRDPTAGADPLVGWQTADEYLSGNVRVKLATALAYTKTEPGRYDANVEALRAAQPKELEAHEIGVRLGVTWIPTSDYQQFIFELLDTPWYFQRQISVTYAAVNCTWNVSGKSADSRDNIKASTTFGTNRINAYELIETSLNLRNVQIFDVIDEKRVLNHRATILAQQKQEAVRQAFRDWIWKDPDRRTRLVSYYNEHFNDSRPRVFDGSHIKFVGMNPEINLRKHQVDAVARILYGGNTLLAHVVGAGKTWEMAAAAMEGKRLGLCRKSLLVVPSHLTEQWGAEFLQLYPAANILVATKKDFETANRKKFCARIATGDFDAVIIGHSQFERVPISLERQQIQLERQISEIELGINDAKAESGERYTIKQMEYTRKNLEEKLKKLTATEGKDEVVTFEELGTDRLFVDEAHYYKNLFLYTKMRNVAGISQTEAAKSSDLYMKCLYMDEITGSRGVIFATGTPISNSMTELYTMMRYLQNEMLRRKGWTFFDAWAAQFGETVTAIELAPEGTGYRQKTRFARFYNLPELMNYWKDVTDVQTADMLNLPVPKANYHNVVVQPTPLQRELVRDLGYRAERVRRGEVEPNVDNMLKITNDGRNLALDQRQINVLNPDDSESKVNACVVDILRIWTDTTPAQGAQLIFCDLSTPKPRVKSTSIINSDGTTYVPEFSVYHDIRDKLIGHGVPAEEIAFIHDANTDNQKAELFAKVRSGDVRILLGSTAKMGAGTNVQTRLAALHHLDVPWRPSDIEQREGRILRQGNQFEEVDIYRYVTEATFDAYSWQLIETKQKFIGQIMTSKSPARSCEDVDTTALSYAEVKALAAGNPKIKERMDLEVEVTKLTMLRSNFQNEHYRLEDQLLTQLPGKIALLEQKILSQHTDIKTATDNQLQDDVFCMEVGNKNYTQKDVAGEALIAMARTVAGVAPVPAGKYRGFALEVLIDALSNEYKIRLVGVAPHTAVLGSDPSGNIMRINNVLERLPEVLGGYEQELTTLRRQVEIAKFELAQEWPQETFWQQKSERLAELNAELHMELTEPSSPPSNEAGLTPEVELASVEQEDEWEEEM